MTASWQRRAAVEDPNVIQAEKSALEDVTPFSIFAVDPPDEVEQELVEHPLQEVAVAFPTSFLLDLVDAPRRPGMDWRVDVAAGPVVDGQVPAGRHVPLPPEQNEVSFCAVTPDRN